MPGNLLRIADRVIGRPLFLHPTKAEIVLRVLDGRMPATISGNLPPDASRFMGSRRRGESGWSYNPAVDGVAVITIEGSLVNRGAWIGTDSGLVSYEGIGTQIRDAMKDSAIHAVILDIDSPGGEATGMFATADLIRELAKVKPVVAVVNDVAASAAYGLASAASEIVVSPTSLVGSIGVVMTHIDASERLAQVRAIIQHEVACAIQKSRMIERNSRKTYARARDLHRDMEKRRALILSQHEEGQKVLQMLRQIKASEQITVAFGVALERLSRLLEEEA